MYSYSRDPKLPFYSRLEFLGAALVILYVLYNYNQDFAVRAALEEYEPQVKPVKENTEQQPSSREDNGLLKKQQLKDFSKTLRGKTATDLTGLNSNLSAVCACESSYEGSPWGRPRHFDPDGSIRMSDLGTNDVGLCQINVNFHGRTAQRLGHDIYTRSGNIQFANWLYAERGYAPWSASKACWKKAVPASRYIGR